MAGVSPGVDLGLDDLTTDSSFTVTPDAEPEEFPGVHRPHSVYNPRLRSQGAQGCYAHRARGPQSLAPLHIIPSQDPDVDGESDTGQQDSESATQSNDRI